MKKKLINMYVGGEKVIILSERGYRKKHHVSYDTVLGMENAFEKEGAAIRELSPVLHRVNSILKWKLHVKTQISDSISGSASSLNWYLYICMGIQDLESNLLTLKKISNKTKHVIIYCFDTWESQYKRWENAFKEINPYCIFFA